MHQYCHEAILRRLPLNELCIMVDTFKRFENYSHTILKQDFGHKTVQIEDIAVDGTAVHVGPRGARYILKYGQEVRKVVLHGKRLATKQYQINNYFRQTHKVPVDEVCFKHWKSETIQLDGSLLINVLQNAKVIRLVVKVSEGRTADEHLHVRPS